MKLKLLSLALITAGSVVAGAPAMAAAPDAAMMLANTCNGCHGPNGNSAGPATPTIAGMATDTFLEGMKAFKEGTRPSTIMTRIAKGYTDDEIKAMAGVFAKEKFVRLPQKTDDAMAKKGKELQKEHCEKCHEDGGRKDEDGSSILAGQWLPYLQFAMADFTSGAREMPKKMKSQVEKAQAKDPKALDALLHFYASQK
jgi:sulfide dehydrogenase cytochrome subunit